MINALGLKGPEQTPEAIKQFLKQPIKHIQVDNSNIQESQHILYNKAKEKFSRSNFPPLLTNNARFFRPNHMCGVLFHSAVFL